jgi:N-acetylmuramoyl-L-alanine amidase
MREALNGRPVGERTRHEYQRVIDSYRRVYFGSPASSKADPSVVATAELMVEMGRRFDDNKILRGAIDQYRFLRKEYPGSKYRFDALFTIGEIYKDDLNDPEEARTAFTEFFIAIRATGWLTMPAPQLRKSISCPGREIEHAAQKTARKQRASSGSATGNSATANAPGASSGSDDTGESANAANDRRSALPRVTGVRHWSTPDYTRVAIDVEQEVKFGSQRISNPDRIFFDLRDTKLASTLVGKTFDVDDGFLKKIRVAEFKPGRTRIVLEVDDLASYDAFLLPDPYRLIIDIHGKDVHGKQKRLTASTASAKSHASATETDAMASSESDDESSAVESRALPPGRIADVPVPAQSKADAAGSRRSGLVETDLPPEDASADSKPNSARTVNNGGVIKTSVAVKGSNRKIPKTIVAADDDSDVRGRCDDATSSERTARTRRLWPSALPSSSSVTRPAGRSRDQLLRLHPLSDTARSAFGS